MRHLLGIAGSLRERSLNRTTLGVLSELCPDDVKLTEASISGIPLYNEDHPIAPVVLQLSAAIEAADGLIIATPEFNYGIPGVLKNAIDWVSRPAYHSVLASKPVAILGASPSGIGTARAQGQLKQVLLGTVSALFPYPEVNIGFAGKKFDERGVLTDGITREQLGLFIQKFSEWVGTQAR